ncbi:MAG: carboxylesterase family protein [Bacteroidales bacterium]|nr:carboxylesterase family protein [Bacteroidales bacterium]
MRKVLFLLSALVLFGCTANVKGPVLTIEGGQVQGVQSVKKGVTVFRGIPYAAAPIGDLRWKEPQPVTPWKGVKVADIFGHPGFQAVHYPGGYTTEWGYGAEQAYSEDCLYLNVWTPAPGKADAKLPVALWIHGGGYREGWGSEPEFEGSEWAAKGVVLVSINYRLGVFGFLTHPDLAAESPHGVSGNYGILDQIESLKWIQKNIAQFGGDPDNVTIFGQSAGAGSVKTLVASPLTEGLIDKAIIMSGGGLTVPQPQAAAPAAMPSMARFPMLTPEEQAAKNKEIFAWAGYDTLEKMRRAGTTEVYALPTIYAGATGQRASLTGSPVVEGYVNTKSFDNACLDGTVANIPYMMGYTMNDMGNMASGIAAFCLNREEQGGKAWAYEFARPLPDDGSEPGVTARLKGAFHSSDLWFVFKTLQYCWRPWTQGDWDLSEKMLTAWTNFAKYGDPNGKDGGDWAPCTKDNQKFMVFKLDKDDKEASELTDPVTELGY